jgi:hypothetical protein
MSARFLTAYLATAGLLVGVFAQAAAKPPQLPVKSEIECDQVELQYSTPEPIAPPTPLHVYRAAPMDPPPVPAKMVQRVYPVADLVVPWDRDPHTDATPMPCPPPFGGYPPQPVPQVRSYLQSAYEYHPEPVRVVGALPPMPAHYGPAACYPMPVPEAKGALHATPPYCAVPCGTESEENDLLSLVEEISTAGLLFGVGRQCPPPPPAVCASKDHCKHAQVHVQESPAGSRLFGVGVNSDAGLTGSIAVNERNFDAQNVRPGKFFSGNSVIDTSSFDANHPEPAPPQCYPGCCAVMRSEQPRKTIEDQLIKLIVNTVQPESWKANGGSGTIEYYPLGMALVIHQSPQVQQQVADLLKSLHRLQDVEVAVEVRFVTVPADFFTQVVNDLDLKFIKCEKGACPGQCPAACAKACCKDPCEGLAFLSDCQVAQFYEKVQADPHTNVMQNPKMTMFNGQESTISIMDTQHFVTRMNFEWRGDQVIARPYNEPVSTGLKMTVQPVVSADKRYVRLCWNASWSEVSPTPVPLYPITFPVTPTYEGGAQGQPAPCTVFIQQPAVCVQAVKKTVCIPDGGTVLLPAWKSCREVAEEVEMPILSKIPYIDELFKKVRKHEETTTTVMLVTPRIICGSGEKAPPVAAADRGPTVVENLQKLEQAQRLFKKAEQCRRRGELERAARSYEAVRQLCPGSRLAQMAARRCQQLHAVEKSPEPSSSARLLPPPAVANYHQEAVDWLGKYYQACAEGNLAEAMQWAIKALAVDPACFSKENKKDSRPALNAN